ncbi:MAG: DUF3160 domain-containing protein [Clostridiales bacterium]|jgi:hypothetical protein|nr:DUF3160 domain-containing protein [Clostridiales bacterium]
MNKLLTCFIPLLLLLEGCGIKAETPPVSMEPLNTQAVADKSPTPVPSPETSADESTQSTGTALEYKNPVIPYAPVNFTVSSQNQTELKPDLSNIVNIASFTNLTPNQREFLAKNHFVVTPGDNQQLFYVYEQNEYKAIPSFITTDSILQLYHVFYDYSLRTTEETALMPELLRLTQGMITELSAEYREASDDEIKQALSDCVAYFVTALRLLGTDASDIPDDSIAKVVDAEVALVTAAEELTDSPLTGIKTDYSIFTVRGHYTRNEDFNRFFRAMMWYGNMYFPVFTKNAPDLAGTRRAMIISNAVVNADLDESWENVFSPTVFYVGQADDLTVFDVYNAMTKISHIGNFWDWLRNASEVSRLSESLMDLNKAKIQQQYQKDGRETQFRFMGQRYTPDSDILQSLTETRKRPYPSALDVAAVLGSSDAAGYIKEYLSPTAEWPEYESVFTQTKERFDALPEETWRSNMYYGWLWSISPLFSAPDNISDYPYFAQTAAWRDKSLATALASWTELRHDTVLYVKESGAEMGGWPETRYPGYVEPSVEVYERLLWLTEFSKENLNARGLLSENMSEKADRIAALLEFLITCSQKELRGEPLTEEEQDQIVRYGGMLESLSVSIATDDKAYDWYQVEPEADRNMAMAVDVHSGPSGALTEAIGTAAEIYVVTESRGKLILTRGAVFDYFERITGSRLTDEEWQAMLQSGNIPERPPWTVSYLETTGIGGTPPNPSYESEPSGEYIISDSDSRALTESELLNLTPLQLKLARNEIYARHGREFSDAELREYFEQMSWYKPSIAVNEFTDDMLNTMEKENVTIIARVEKLLS